MVLTRAQLDSLSKEELVEELLKFSNIADQLQSLTKWFDHFIGKQASVSGCSTTLEKERSFQPQFGEVSALLDVRHCPKLQYYAISKKGLMMQS